MKFAARWLSRFPMRRFPVCVTLLERGTSNGLQGLTWLLPEQLREREPHAAGKAAVLVPEEGIVDYGAVCEELREEIVRAGGAIRLNFPVKRIQRISKNWRLESHDNAVEAEFLDQLRRPSIAIGWENWRAFRAPPASFLFGASITRSARNAGTWSAI